MSDQKKIVAVGGFAVPKKSSEPKGDIEIDFEEVMRRSDDIDQLTAEYIIALMDADGVLSPEALELEPTTLESIEDEFERILAEHGIYIYRPLIVEGSDGKEVVLPGTYSGG